MIKGTDQPAHLHNLANIVGSPCQESIQASICMLHSIFGLAKALASMHRLALAFVARQKSRVRDQAGPEF